MADVLPCQTCGAVAIWEYAPSDGSGFYCDTCVPRGCSCNVLDYDDPRPDAPQETDMQGRLLPCVEYECWPEGVPVESLGHHPIK